MTRKAILLCGAVTIAHISMPTTARAQSIASSGEPKMSAATAQAQADIARGQTATSNAPATVDSDIVVTGIRASLQNSQEVKRLAPSIIEKITSEDLGKFTDTALSDALNRVPGVQLQRNDNQEAGDNISIRGLSGEYVRNEVNGREALSYGNAIGGSSLRTYNFDSIPTEIIGSVTVYKTSTASDLEPGVAGAVNIQTIRPLDVKSKVSLVKNVFGSVAISGFYNDLAKKAEPRFSGVVGTKLFDDTLGLYVGGLWGKEQSRVDLFVDAPLANQTVRYDTTGSRNRNVYQTATNVVVPDLDLRVLNGENTRQALTAGAQWRPNDNFEANIDFLYNAFDQVQVRGAVQPHERGLATDIYQGDGISFITLPNGLRAVTALDTTKCINASGGACVSGAYNTQIGLTGPTRGETAQQFSRNSDTIGGGINLVWHNDVWRVRGDYSYTKLYSLQRTAFAGVTESPATFRFSGFASGSIPSLEFLSPAGNDYSQIGICCTYIGEGQNRSDKHTFQLDIERQLGQFRVKVGAVHNRTDIDFRYADRFFFYSDGANGGGGTGPNGTAGPYDRIFTPELRNTYLSAGYSAGGVLTAFEGTSHAISFPYFDSAAACRAVGPTYCSAFTNVGTYSFNGVLPTSAEGLRGLGDPLVDGYTYRLFENTTSGYAQADYAGSLFELPFSGNLGLRVLHEEVQASGFSGIRYQSDRSGFQTAGRNPNVQQLVTDQNSYTEFLPSLNTNLSLTRNIALRFSVSRTASLPSYEQLIPNGQATIYENKNYPGYLGIPDDANFGNTRLKPITAWNFDFTTEWYTRNGGSFVFSAFYKDVKNFIFTRSRLATLPALDPFPLASGNIFNVVAPFNVGAGSVKGFEFGLNQPFTFLPGLLKNFGFQGNFTYVDSKFDNPDNRAELSLGFPGASKYNGNAILYYEKSGLQLRGAYVYRSSYLTGTSVSTFAGDVLTVNRGYGTVDLSASYRIIPNIEITGAVSNVTGVQSRQDYEPIGLFQQLAQRPRIFSVSLRGYF